MEAIPQTAADQDYKYAKSIGQGVPTKDLSEIVEFSGDVALRDWYKDKKGIQFWWERFDKDGLTKMLCDLADGWVQVNRHVDF